MSRGRGYLHIPVRDRDRYIYRILPSKYLHDLFDTGTNFLPDPASWEDPFENLLFRSNSGPAIYAQCWSLHSFSDAMWRIYSPKQESVRVRTTVRTLLNSLRARHPDTGFIGKVRYLTTPKLKRFATKSASAPNRGDPEQQAQTVLVKRPAFRHEKEVRLVLVQTSRHRGYRSSGYRYEIDPHLLVDQIMLDPRIEPQQANKLKQSLRKRLGFRGKVLRSLLYAPPTELVEVLQHSARVRARRPTSGCS